VCPALYNLQEGALIGALEAATFRSIGLSKLTDGPRIAAHSLAGGVFSALQGGSFGHGFVSAGLAKFLDVKILDGIEDPALYALANVAAGGTVSAVTGGKFASGALTAAFQVSFNGFLSSLKKIGGGIRDGAGLLSDEIGLPTGRRLTQGEKALLTSVFGGSLNQSKIRVVASADLEIAGVGTEGRTIGNKIRLFGTNQSDDFSLAGADKQSLFVHEATHVWQNQNDPNYTHLKAAAEQSKPGAYSTNLTHASLKSYGYEQQAAIVAGMFKTQNSMNLTSKSEMRQFLKIQSVVYGPGGISR